MNKDTSTPLLLEEVIQAFLVNLQLLTLTTTQLELLNSSLTVPEIEKVTDSLPSGKSPGPGGYGLEQHVSSCFLKELPQVTLN